jgi:hypothetical protein
MMTSPQPTFPWRGYVNQMTYGTDLRHRVDDSLVTRLADELICQRYFTHPVESYYHAAVTGLESGESMTLDENQNQEVVRDLLTRLVHALDERRPWPESPFASLDASEWSAMCDAAVIGRIPLKERDVQSLLHRVFSEISPDGSGGRVLILRLRTGQVVALLSPTSFTTPGIDLLARTEPTSTLAAFRDLTGIHVESK